ncbi:MAG: glycosyltransferase, partial [bacterium]
MDNLNICFSSDDNYVQHLGTAVTSILVNGDAENNYNFHILDGGISDENKQKLLELKKIKDFNIEFYKINSDEFECCPLNRFYISLATFYRFKIPSLLPKSINRILYLDCDIVVMKDLKEMFFTDIGGCFAAVVEDEG